MSRTDPPGRDADDVLAGEFALGVLRGADEAEARRRAEREPGFARAVARWDAALTGLCAELPPEEPPTALKRRLDAAMGGAAPAAPPPPRRWVWPAIAAGLGAVAVGEAALLALRPEPPVVVRQVPVETGESGPYVAVLSPSEGPAPILVSLDLPQGLLTVDPSGLEAGDRAVQLWLLPPGGGEPVSLGLLAPNVDNTVEVPVALAGLPRDALPSLAISLEPEGGSPTGLPTGPVVAAGAVRPLRDEE